MAKEKTMIRRAVIQSEKYSSLSDKAARLYIELNLEADGMGAVRPRRPALAIGAGEEHVRELLDRGLVCEVEGCDERVVLIMDWWHMNKLDRSKLSTGSYAELIDAQFEFDNRRTKRYVPKGKGEESVEEVLVTGEVMDE